MCAIILSLKMDKVSLKVEKDLELLLKDDINNFLGNNDVSKIFEKCFINTLETTCEFQKDGSVFVVTGDIPAMWLRDSSAQVMQYLSFAHHKEVSAFIKGVLKKQFSMILIDPYANAFMRDETCVSEWEGCVQSDRMPKIVWERKFELDSLCYPLFLLVKYFEATEDLSCFDNLFFDAFDRIIQTVKIEQKHSEKSTYYFYRKLTRVEDVGYNNPKSEKGLVWSGFRPSDDPCKYSYHIPDNMFLVTVLYRLSKIFKESLGDKIRAVICENLVNELKCLIQRYGIVEDEQFGRVYVSETDCLGNFHIDDDANIPSLLSIPYLEYPFIDKEIYKNTRALILSKRNRYYYEGSILKGIGSPHTPENRVWPLALSMQGITSENEDEIIECLKMLIASTNGTGLMHEGVDCNDVSLYSRPWFAWANSLFSYFILKKKDIIKPHIKTLK